MNNLNKWAGILGVVGCALGAAGKTAHAATSYSVIILGVPDSLAYGVSNGQAVGQSPFPPSTASDAALWNGPNNVVNLGPVSAYSQAFGISNGQEVGDISTSTSEAVVWSGSATSAVNLNPSGFASSYATGIYNGQEVGVAELPNTGSTAGANHAMLWSGTAASAVDLNPAGAAASGVLATDGGQQAGWMTTSTSTAPAQATLWTGSAQSAVNLNPANFYASEATGVSAGQQVGWGSNPASNSSVYHAMLWSGTAASAVDLNPEGVTSSQALGISNGVEVGVAGNDAALWTGSAASYVDLQQFLPSQFTSSTATAIDAQGEIVGYAYNGTSEQAVMWVPQAQALAVPLPRAAWMGLLTLGMIGTMAPFRQRLFR